MIAKATMQALEEQGWGYILGVRMRSSKEFAERVLGTEEEETRIEVERAWRPEPLELGVGRCSSRTRPRPGRQRRSGATCCAGTRSRHGGTRRCGRRS